MNATLIDVGHELLSSNDLWKVAPPRNVGERALLSQEQKLTFDVPLSHGLMRIEVTGPEPGWLYRVLQGVQHVVALPTNWDSYGGARIQDAAVLTAMRLLSRTLGSLGVAPMVVPTSLGGIQLEWHQNGLDIEIDVTPAGGASAYVRDEAVEGPPWEIDHITPEAISNLRTVLARVH